MDLTYGSQAREAFLTNVGLISSNGPHGYNIMPAEWTYQISYDPPLIAVSVGPKKATHDNISATRQFGVTMAADDQNILSSLAGAYSGKTIDKVGFLRELGFTFSKAEHIDVFMPEGGVTAVECELIDQKTQGDHVLFIGKALSVKTDPSKTPILYHRNRYWRIGEEIPKPTQEEREEMKKVGERFGKQE